MIYCGLIIYFLLVVGAGIFASKRIGNADDYLVAGRKMPFWVILPTIVATWFGAGSCMGVSGKVYESGVGSSLADPFGCAIALLISSLFFAAPMRRMRLLTSADVIRKAYGKIAEVIAACGMLPVYVGTLAAQMVALGFLWHIITGLPVTTGIVIGSCVLVGYTTIGGMWLVAITDIVQLIFLIFGLLLIVFKAPILSVDFATIQAEALQLLPTHHNLSVYLGQLCLVGLGATMGQDLIQRFLSARSPQIARRAGLASALLYLTLGMIPIMIGLSSRHLHNLDNSEMLIIHLAQTYLSPALYTFFILGLLSAIMSTADSYLLAASSVFVQNVIAPIKVLPKENKLKMMRICSPLLALVAFLLALYAQSIFDLMIHSGAFLCVMVFVPVACALYKKDLHRADALTSMFAGLLVWTATLIIKKSACLTDALYIAALYGIIASSLGYLISAKLRSTRLFPQAQS